MGTGWRAGGREGYPPPGRGYLLAYRRLLIFFLSTVLCSVAILLVLCSCYSWKERNKNSRQKEQKRQRVDEMMIMLMRR